MKLKKILSSVLAAAMVLSTASFNVLAADADIYKVGADQEHKTLADAIAAAQDTNNDVITYQVSGTVDYNHDSRGYSETLVGDTRATKVIIEGVDGTDATLNVVGYNGSNGANNDINPDGVEIEIRNIKITDNQNHYTSDSGWAVVSIAGTSVTLNNVTTDDVSLRLDGACGNLTIKGGTYNGPDGYYPIFIDNIDGNFTIRDATINSARGIKIGDARYQAVSGKVVIEDCVFNGLSKKPAVNVSHVNTETSSVEINNATLNNCEYGLLANEVTGSDITVDGKQPAYVAMVNGNLYTSVAYAEAESKGNTVEVPVAKVGSNKYYTSIEDALEAAVENDTITLLAGTHDAFYIPKEKEGITIVGAVDAEGNNLTVIKTMEDDSTNRNGGVYCHANNVTFRNLKFTSGTKDFGWKTAAIGNDNEAQGLMKNVTVENCDFVGSGIGSAVWLNDGSVTFRNNTVTGYKYAVQLYKIGDNNAVVVKNSKLTTSNRVVFNQDGTANGSVTVTGCEIDAPMLTVGGGVPATITGNKIEGVTFYIYGKTVMSENQLIDCEYNTSPNGNITLTENYVNNVNEIVGMALTENIDFVNYYVTAEDLENKANLTTVPDKAETIYVQFRNTNPDAEDMANSVWEIVLVGDEEIHELASVDLTFENNSKLAADTTKENPYTIVAKEGMTLSKKGDNHYMFSFDANTVEETNTEISLGTITFGGYGALNFKVDATATTDNQNIANATEIANSIVETFVVGGATDSDDKTGDLVINTDAPDALDKEGNLVGVIGGTSVEVPSRNLTINVTFPNAVEDNVIAYQDMVVTVKGTNVATSKVDTSTYNLGKDDGNAMYANGNYVIDNIKLSQNGTYTVTVTGAGYRTVSYDVHMTDDKELTFWNNVMDAPKVVEKDNADSTETVTFLAGDIVKDDNINIYDLSAVVSYFATKTTTTGYDEKAQYDLNRDGMIDSKDVAYVLVSWGK